MKLSYVNNVLIFIVLIILSKLAYNIFMNKKNVESFINRWSLNSHGQLCHNNGSCKNIAVLDTNSNRICSIESDTLNCNDITTPSGGGNDVVGYGFSGIKLYPVATW